MAASHVRNFGIIAHIDHGKSTLADRFLELTHMGRTAGTCELRSPPSELHLYDEAGDTLSINDLEIKSATITVKEWV